MLNQSDSKTSARVDILSEIGYWGITAEEFVSELNKLDVDEIDLHVNSPGGSAADGVTIYNNLRDHSADVIATVDGWALSAASVIVQAADERVMNVGATMMIHDAWGLAIGNASDMREMAVILDKISNSIAGVYALRSGGGIDDWIENMAAETWYNAGEAVEAGLADRAVDQPTTDGDGDGDGDGAEASWDLSIFQFPTRDAAGPPRFFDRAPIDSVTNPKLEPRKDPEPVGAFSALQTAVANN